MQREGLERGGGYSHQVQVVRTQNDDDDDDDNNDGAATKTRTATSVYQMRGKYRKWIHCVERL